MQYWQYSNEYTTKRNVSKHDHDSILNSLAADHKLIRLWQIVLIQISQLPLEIVCLSFTLSAALFQSTDKVSKNN